MKKEENEIIKRIQDYALEEIMGLRFGAYAKEIIQDRAIPDVRDGLKPVQRRILYDMYKQNNDSNHAFMKCAKTVGDVLGKYHPHGDTSVYDAMVRMSQWWKQNHQLIDIHGNNGSMDGDGPAAYRYTEARLAKISDELLRDLDKNTVAWAPNFDDTLLEPTVLPAKFPNLLVNGANGISAGYATYIPPHNLGEIIDATVKRIESPNCRLDTILEIVKGPDFPTGGIACGKQGIIDAFTTGRGKVIVKSRYEFKKEKGKEQIIIDEIPFDVNKAMLVQKMDAIRIDKKLDGIAEVRDESDREGLRIVIDLKPNANKDVIINYLLKNTELQITFNYNMVAIVNRRPMTLGIIPLLDAYIAHQKEVVTKRSEFDLANYKARLNIVNGFLKMMSILDKVIQVIRASKNKSDAKDNLMKEFSFNLEQAEAIVMLQLYRLTNTDVLALQEEQESLKKYIEALELILSDEEKLKDVMKHELKKVKSEYGIPRKTVIEDEITEIKLDEKDLITKENVVVTITHEGYIKKTSIKSYQASNGEEPMLKPGDYVTNMFEVNTLDNIVIFTNLGQYLYVPVHIINDAKWKELGKHVNNLIGGMAPEERIIASIVLDNKNDEVTSFTKKGMIKRTKLGDFIVSRYTKAMTSFKIKDDDEVVNVVRTKDRSLFITENGKYLNFNTEEVSLVGPKAAGVKGISLTDDNVVSAFTYNKDDEYLTIFTNNKTSKRVKLNELELHTRAKKGSNLIKKVKAFDYKILIGFITNSRDNVMMNVDGDFKLIKGSDISIMDLQSTGSSIAKSNVLNAFVPALYEVYKENNNQEQGEKKPEIIKEEVKEAEQTSLDDFYQDFKL
jgi:topoisomerase-4 subunit A